MFHLHIMTKKFLFESKITINSRIVVVGASTVGLSFINTLLKIGYLNFTNLVVVNPGGLVVPGTPNMHIYTEVLYERGLPSTRYLPISNGYTTHEFLQLGIQARVNVVEGKMVQIDREKKLMALQNGAVLRYDYLVITTGLQDQTAFQLGELIEPPLTEPLEGLLSLSGQNSAQVLDELLIERKRISESSGIVLGKIIVYGTLLEAHCSLHGILSAGIDSREVMVVIPSALGGTSYNNNVIDKKISEQLRLLHINVRTDLVVSRVECGEEGKVRIAAFKVTKNNDVDGNGGEEEERAACSLLVSCCGNQDVDPDAFYAINDSCLTYDGRLVIDHKYHTNDPFMYLNYSSGSLTKFARKYRSRINLEDYSSIEIGEKLAQSVLSVIDPTHNEEQDPPSLPLNIKFKKPKMKAGIVPGGFYYCHIWKPLPVTQGSELCTENNGRYRYFTHIHKEGIIPDILDYLRTPFTMGLYHDRFSDFRDYIEESLHDHVHHQIKNKETDQNAAIISKKEDLLDRNSKNFVQLKLFEYVEEHARHLSMYYIPAAHKAM